MTQEYVWLARTPVAAAAITIIETSEGLQAYPAYWSRATGSVAPERPCYTQDEAHYRNESASIAAKLKSAAPPAQVLVVRPYESREAAIEAEREKAAAWFDELSHRVTGKAKDEALDLITRLKGEVQSAEGKARPIKRPSAA